MASWTRTSRRSKALAHDGFVRLAVAPAHLAILAALPFHYHDPFDHLLIAQATNEDALLVSEDRNMPLYPVRPLTCSAP